MGVSPIHGEAGSHRRPPAASGGLPLFSEGSASGEKVRKGSSLRRVCASGSYPGGSWFRRLRPRVRGTVTAV